MINSCDLVHVIYFMKQNNYCISRKFYYKSKSLLLLIVPYYCFVKFSFIVWSGLVFSSAIFGFTSWVSAASSAILRPWFYVQMAMNWTRLILSSHFLFWHHGAIFPAQIALNPRHTVVALIKPWKIILQHDVNTSCNVITMKLDIFIKYPRNVKSKW